jgi:methionine-rich copper-binding protein CopC
MKRLVQVISLSMFVFLGTNIAAATSIVSTSPTAGSILSISPSAVSIKANSDLVEGANSIEVTNPSGVRVDDGSVQVQGSVLLVGLKPLETSGTYTVSYSLMVIDEESASGTFTFIYNSPGEVTMATPEPTTSEDPLSTNNPNRLTDLFVVALLIFAFIVLVFLSRYAKQTFNTPSKPKVQRRNPSTSKKFLK